MSDSSSVAAPEVKKCKRDQKFNSDCTRWIQDYIRENFKSRAQLNAWRAVKGPPIDQLERVVKDFKKQQRFLYDGTHKYPLQKETNQATSVDAKREVYLTCASAYQRV